MKSIDKYMGIDMPFPCDTKDKQTLLLSCSLLDAYIHNPVNINADMFAHMVIEKYITVGQHTFLYNLCKHLTAWNIFIGTKEDLYSFGTDEKNVKRMLTSLGNMVEVDSWDKLYKGGVKVRVNPILAWKGDKVIQYKTQQDWYSVKNMKGRDQIILGGSDGEGW